MILYSYFLISLLGSDYVIINYIAIYNVTSNFRVYFTRYFRLCLPLLCLCRMLPCFLLI